MSGVVGPDKYQLMLHAAQLHLYEKYFQNQTVSSTVYMYNKLSQDTGRKVGKLMNV